MRPDGGTSGRRVAAVAALDWLDRSLERFAPDTASPAPRLKPFGELLLLLENADDRLAPDFAERRRIWLRWAWDRCERGDLLLRVLAATEDPILPAAAYASFVRHGFDHPRLGSLCRHVVQTADWAASDVPPWRRLELRHIAARLSRGGTARRGTGGDSLDGTWLAARPEPWLVSEDRAYGATHALFYATDFGRHPERIAPPLREYLELWLPVWLEISAGLGNHDLFAELLAVAAHARLAGVHESWLPTLLAQQAADGAFPGPRADPAETSPDRRFDTHYHATIVALLALGAHGLTETAR